MSKEPINSPAKKSWRGTLLGILTLVIAGCVIGLAMEAPQGWLRGLPTSWQDAARALLVLLVGLAVSRLLERRLFHMAAQHLRVDHAASLKYLVRLILFVTMVLALLAAVGIGLSSIVFGGAFVTVIVGLAGQQVFANIIGGVWLILFHPFRVGDQIGLVTWQYPLLMPSYPHEAMRPAYYGLVHDINLMYTALENSDGFLQLIPNGIIVQAFVENRSAKKRSRLRVRFDTPLEVNVPKLVEQTRDALQSHFKKNGERNVVVRMADMYPTGYSFLVTLETDRFGDDVRDEILQIAAEQMATVRTL
ncbi:mechanosensitive ion channel family protein [Ferroacidibacillus organovorans]|uniref:mechanosensitive ion channel family protein n=1 Tax=Ferroacidibacillus organovorans TaxID=1765683 RepID=UPI00136667E3|nr:mechanosensitive ion channel family protein [Ferroacidibacillus organovorans]